MAGTFKVQLARITVTRDIEADAAPLVHVEYLLSDGVQSRIVNTFNPVTDPDGVPDGTFASDQADVLEAINA